MKNKKSNSTYEVICAAHGRKDIDRPFMPPMVQVGVPKHKRDRRAGCPICAKIKEPSE